MGLIPCSSIDSMELHGRLHHGTLAFSRRSRKCDGIRQNTMSRFGRRTACAGEQEGRWTRINAAENRYDLEWSSRGSEAAKMSRTKQHSYGAIENEEPERTWAAKALWLSWRCWCSASEMPVWCQCGASAMPVCDGILMPVQLSLACKCLGRVNPAAWRFADLLV